MSCRNLSNNIVPKQRHANLFINSLLPSEGSLVNRPEHNDLLGVGGSQASLFSVNTFNAQLRSLAPSSPCQSSAVHRLESVTSKLTTVIQMISAYRQDVLVAQESAEKIANLLTTSNSTESHFNACCILRKLLQQQASRHGLANSEKLIESLVSLLQTTQDLDTQTEAAITLRQLCNTKSASLMVSKFLPIPIQVKLLNHPTELIKVTALSLMHKQMLFFPVDMRSQVRDCGGPIHLASLLNTDRISNPSWLTMCADAIRMTAFEDHETKLILMDSGLSTQIVSVMRSTGNEKLLFALARLIKVLSVSTDCKQNLVEAGVIQELSRFLTSNQESLVLEALWGLRNLSDQAVNLADDSATQLIHLLIPLLSSTFSNEHIPICTVGCLCNLTCQNARNKETLIRLDGVSNLCKCIRDFQNRDEVCEPICSTLRNLTNQNGSSITAVEQIQICGALEDIANVLSFSDFSSTKLPLIKAVVGLLCNLSSDLHCCVELQKLEVTRNLMKLQTWLGSTLGYSPCQTLPPDNQCKITEIVYNIEGVNLEELLELVLVTLQSICKHVEAGLFGFIQTSSTLLDIVQYLYGTCQGLHKSTLGLLNTIAISNAGAVAIEKLGAVARITELVQSSDPATAAYSASVLHRIAQLKSVDYQRRMSLELRHALYDGGLVHSTSNWSPKVVLNPLKTKKQQSIASLQDDLSSKIPTDSVSGRSMSQQSASSLFEQFNLDPIFSTERETSQLI